MKKTIGQILIFASFFAFLDQLAKFFIEKFFSPPYTIVENTGMAFGIPIPNWTAVIVAIILIPIIIYFGIKELKISERLSQISLSLIVGGAIGNLIDRLTVGHVVDFIAIWKWPDFNLADIFITIGILLLLIRQIKQQKEHQT